MQDVDALRSCKALRSLKDDIDVRNPEVTYDIKFCSSAYQRRKMYLSKGEGFDNSNKVDQGVNNVKSKTQDVGPGLMLSIMRN